MADRLGRYADAIRLPAQTVQVLTSGTPGLTPTGAIPESFEAEVQHAWFNVRVELERFIRRGDEEILLQALTEPNRPATSGGFVYAGTTTVDVWPGDTYGFRMSGSDFGSY